MESETDEKIKYSLRRRRSGIDKISYSYRLGSDLQVSEIGSLEFFLLERYMLYTYASKKEKLITCRVHHDPYRFCLQDGTEWNSMPCSWNGLSLLSEDAVHACAANSVSVSIFAP